jgi:hypothetical protein
MVLNVAHGTIAILTEFMHVLLMCPVCDMFSATVADIGVCGCGHELQLLLRLSA